MLFFFRSTPYLFSPRIYTFNVYSLRELAKFRELLCGRERELMANFKFFANFSRTRERELVRVTPKKYGT